MARYIDADALEKQLNRYVEYNDDGEQEINADEVFITLHEQPTADVRENVWGEWIRRTRVEAVYSVDGVKTWGIKYQCNKCGFAITVVEDFGHYRFCPNCGADMRGEKYDA